MAITRADALSQTSKVKKEFFSDFVNSFGKTPVGNQLGRVTDIDSVNQSLRNLIKTNLGERLFQPMIGSEVYASLFENNYIENTDMIQLFIENTIKNNEPRVELNEVIINSSRTDENVLEVTIVYNVINNPEPVTLNVLLKRVR
jgi:phage baseplate assembly protein W